MNGQANEDESDSPVPVGHGPGSSGDRHGQPPDVDLAFVWDLSTAYNASLRYVLFDEQARERQWMEPDLDEGTPAWPDWPLSIVYRSDGDWPEAPGSPTCKGTTTDGYEPEWVYDCSHVDRNATHILNATDDWRTVVLPLDAHGEIRIGFLGNATIRYVVSGGPYPEHWVEAAGAEGKCNTVDGYVAGFVGDPSPGHGQYDIQRVADRAITDVMPWVGVCR